MNIFSANGFPGLGQRRAPVRYRRRPGSREDAFILDRELELQSFALVGRIGYPSFGRRTANFLFHCVLKLLWRLRNR